MAKSKKGFLEKFAKGGEYEGKAKSSKPPFLKKSYEQDLVLEITSARINISSNPKTKGQEQFIVEMNVVSGESGQPDVMASESGTYFIKLGGLTNEYAEVAAFQEMANFLAVAVGTDVNEFVEDPTAIYDLLEDDGDEVVGNRVALRTGDQNDAGYWNFYWSRPSE